MNQVTEEQAPVHDEAPVEEERFVRDRVLFPILVPVVAAAVVGFAVLNLSRVLLASGHNHSNKPVVIASVIAILIIAGAVWATSRDRVPSSTVYAGAALVGLLLVGVGLLAQEVDSDNVAEDHGEEDGGDVAGSIEVVAVDIDFEEKQLTAPVGEVEVTLDNQGASVHNFVVEGREEETKVEATGGTTETGVVAFEEEGEFTFYCSIPGHRAAGMEGTLAVEEGAGGGGAAAPAGGGEPVHVVAEDIDFPEKEFEAAAGEVAFEYENTGAILHTLVVEGREADMRIEAAAGDTGTGAIELDAGTYTLYCDIPGHRGAGMEGTVTVKGAGAPPREGKEEAPDEAPPPEPGPEASQVSVIAEDIDFPKTEFEAGAGMVGFEYVNEGAILHTLVIEGLEDEMKLEAPGGETDTGEIELDAGTYTLYCDVPGHRGAGMEAELSVT